MNTQCSHPHQLSLLEAETKLLFTVCNVQKTVSLMTLLAVLSRCERKILKWTLKAGKEIILALTLDFVLNSVLWWLADPISKLSLASAHCWHCRTGVRTNVTTWVIHIEISPQADTDSQESWKVTFFKLHYNLITNWQYRVINTCKLPQILTNCSVNRQNYLWEVSIHIVSFYMVSVYSLFFNY